MMLPEGVKKFNEERKQREEEKRLQEFQKLIQLTSSTSTSSTTEKSLISSNQVSDVIYDDDYAEEKMEEKEDLIEKINKIPSMDLKAQSQNELTSHLPEVRDFSIDVWNGSPGLNQWGYNGSSHKE